MNDRSVSRLATHALLLTQLGLLDDFVEILLSFEVLG